MPFKLALDGNRAHMTGKATLDRTAFGVGQGEWAAPTPVAHEVTVSVDLTATKSGARALDCAMTDADVAIVRAADAAAISAAAPILRAGRLVAFPTETVYGLGADATNGRAVAAIFVAKGRPHFNPLIVHVRDVGASGGIRNLFSLAEKLAQAFWPGALTLVLPRREDCRLSLLVSAGLDTVAVRAPSHPVAQRLIAEAGRAARRAQRQSLGAGQRDPRRACRGRLSAASWT